MSRGSWSQYLEVKRVAGQPVHGAEGAVDGRPLADPSGLRQPRGPRHHRLLLGRLLVFHTSKQGTVVHLDQTGDGAVQIKSCILVSAEWGGQEWGGGGRGACSPASRGGAAGA